MNPATLERAKSGEKKDPFKVVFGHLGGKTEAEVKSRPHSAANSANNSRRGSLEGEDDKKAKELKKALQASKKKLSKEQKQWFREWNYRANSEFNSEGPLPVPGSHKWMQQDRFFRSFFHRVNTLPRDKWAYVVKSFFLFVCTRQHRVREAMLLTDWPDFLFQLINAFCAEGEWIEEELQDLITPIMAIVHQLVKHHFTSWNSDHVLVEALKSCIANLYRYCPNYKQAEALSRSLLRVAVNGMAGSVSVYKTEWHHSAWNNLYAFSNLLFEFLFYSPTPRQQNRVRLRHNDSTKDNDDTKKAQFEEYKKTSNLLREEEKELKIHYDGQGCHDAPLVEALVELLDNRIKVDQIMNYPETKRERRKAQKALFKLWKTELEFWRQMHLFFSQILLFGGVNQASTRVVEIVVAAACERDKELKKNKPKRNEFQSALTALVHAVNVADSGDNMSRKRTVGVPGRSHVIKSAPSVYRSVSNKDPSTPVQRRRMGVANPTASVRRRLRESIGSSVGSAFNPRGSIDASRSASAMAEMMPGAMPGAASPRTSTSINSPSITSINFPIINNALSYEGERGSIALPGQNVKEGASVVMQPASPPEPHPVSREVSLGGLSPSQTSSVLSMPGMLTPPSEDCSPLDQIRELAAPAPSPPVEVHPCEACQTPVAYKHGLTIAVCPNCKLLCSKEDTPILRSLEAAAGDEKEQVLDIANSPFSPEKLGLKRASLKLVVGGAPPAKLSPRGALQASPRGKSPWGREKSPRGFDTSLDPLHEGPEDTNRSQRSFSNLLKRAGLLTIPGSPTNKQQQANLPVLQTLDSLKTLAGLDSHPRDLARSVYSSAHSRDTSTSVEAEVEASPEPSLGGKSMTQLTSNPPSPPSRQASSLKNRDRDSLTPRQGEMDVPAPSTSVSAASTPEAIFFSMDSEGINSSREGSPRMQQQQKVSSQ
eukprot:g67745.t1